VHFFDNGTLLPHEVLIMIYGAVVALVAWKVQGNNEPYWKRHLRMIPVVLVAFLVYAFGLFVWKWLK
jgi:hypothetical protein